MVKSRVALVRCQSYDEPEVAAALRRGMDLLGGMAACIAPGEQIVLKPNLLVGAPPEKLVSPHPSVFAAVARLALEVTPNLSYGDSPGSGRAQGQMRKAGLAQVAEALGIPLADFDSGREVHFPESPFIKQFTLANGVLDADGLISIGKFKTHGITRITGPIKNQFGCVPGALKPQFHIRLPDPLDFARMLVCLNLYLRPRLYVIDGIVAMEGNGPRNGDPVPLGVLLLSRDPVALESVMCRLIDLDPACVPTLKPGREWGLGSDRPEEIELVGDALEPLVNPAFKVVRAPVKPLPGSAALALVRNLLAPRPAIDASRCNRCATCIRMCPVTPPAIDWPCRDRSQAPVYSYGRCVRCFCCQELCPEGAIAVHTPLAARLFQRFWPA